MGCVYRRDEIWHIKYYANGKPFYESSHSKVKAVAERLLRMREAEIDQGRRPGVVFDRVDFDELAEDMLEDYRINRKRSLPRAERTVKRLLSEFGGMRATQITTALIREYDSKRIEEGAANATINREHAALKRMFKLGNICTPPKVAQVPYIPMLREDNVRKGFFEHDMFQNLMKHLPDYARPVVFFGYCCGWRKEEILSLKWEQVDRNQGIARLEPGDPKNREGRTVYMEEELLQILNDRHLKRASRCPYVFHVNGERIKDFRKAWDTACKKAGLWAWDEKKEREAPTKLFHDLRRTAVRNMVRAGIPERVAMTISGHKTRSVFERYNIVSPDDLKAAALKRQEYWRKQAQWLQNSYNRPDLHQKARGHKPYLRLVTP